MFIVERAPKPYSNYYGPYIRHPDFESYVRWNSRRSIDMGALAACWPPLEGSGVLISRVISPRIWVISPLIWVISIVTLLITPLITTHEPASGTLNTGLQKLQEASAM